MPKDNTDLVIQELIKAQSALNMEPRPFPIPDGPYLSEMDYWVKHSYEHIDKAIQMLASRK